MEAKTLFRQLLPSPSGRIIAMLILLLTISGTSVAAEKEAYAMKKYYSATSYSDSYYTLTFFYDDLRSTRGDETYDLNTGNDNPGWIG
ncbi:MAG: hypothetical protein IJV45_09015 [Prevotella sp.]|nr:hypothetical protein [Prevotella sp.]